MAKFPRSQIFYYTYRRFLKPPFTFHQVPETLFQSGIEGETWSFHRCNFVPPVCRRENVATAGVKGKLAGERSTFHPQSRMGKGFPALGER
jgi:hypothetical protein